MPELLSLLIALVVLVVAARLGGSAAERIGQPPVVGEMVVGIALGPSLLGWLWPAAAATLFPEDLLPHLFTLSQVGLLIFMFLVGLEFDHGQLRRLGHTAVLASHASITIPALFGCLAALYLYPRLSSDAVGFREFALFMAVAMSVTAFPVLARILRERRLQDTPLGTVTIACAAVDDVTAWCLLAGVVALVRVAHGGLPVALMVAGLAVYVGAMLVARRTVLPAILTTFQRRERLTDNLFAAVIALVLLSAWVTEWLGLHLLFGAFFAGVALPKSDLFVRALRERLEMVATVLLLPIFFAFTGLRTEIGLVQGREMWFYFGLILLLAVSGKLLGSTIAARMTGLSWRDATALGILMNTRGLMELVVLNIGLELGVISPALFSMMVLMALVTTFMTTPLVEVVYGRAQRRTGVVPTKQLTAVQPDFAP
jgi:Kef-type K+ transport system membrane component KefB